MENELFPKHEAPPPKPSKLSVMMEHLLRKKVLVISGAVLVVAGMGSYILIAPTEQKLAMSTPVATIPTPTPTVIQPTSTPTVTPTPPPPTATPTITPTPTPTIPPGNLWNTFYDQKNGYRIQYPPDWVAKDLSPLEPKIPTYINVQPIAASASSRFITIGITTRTYEEQLALGASSSAVTVAGIKGTKQFFQDSDGNTSTVVILPRKNDLIVLRAKTAYNTIFNLMLSTLKVTTK